ncbi:cytochrome b N-terminal domain-containing protein [Lentisalinibacter salinarum]|uniref:cytochrome b N-terminal domain-containing protein n=1 Tax=Lentisalinibacter salinarum TaxID=2992239 RepID=UPI00386E404F
MTRPVGREDGGPGRVARGLARLETPFSRVFGDGVNPFHHLGALAIYFLYVALVTGIYLFVFYRTSLQGAWPSVEAITHDQPYAGGIMRSLHRFASDAAVLMIVLHLLRELIRGRFTGPRWFSWITAMPLIWIIFAFGVTGYWMVWDELAQYVAIGTARMLDWLPIITEPMSRSFLDNDSVSSRLFTLIAFLHLVGLPIACVLSIWFHLLRVRYPRINPPRRLMAGSLMAMLALALVFPVTSHPPADLGRPVGPLAIDWFYLAGFPLLSLTSESLLWALSGGGTLMLAALPWIAPHRRDPVAAVYLPDCSGCTFCAEDCPYGAIDMVPRSDGRNFEFEARVNSSLCVSCGICTGSCPSSSPFRQREPLTTGIEMPHYPVESLRTAIDHRGDTAENALVIFGCDYAVRAERFDSDFVHSIAVPCIGLVPPAAIDYAMRSTGYRGVVLSGCEGCDCYHRLGNRWTEERIERIRRPGLRGRVDRERLLTVWLKAGDAGEFGRRLDAFGSGLGVSAGTGDSQDGAGAPQCS